MRQPVSKTILTCISLLLIWSPAHRSSSQGTLSPLSAQDLPSLETSISTAWRNNDRVTFQADTNTALAVIIPKALLDIGSAATAALPGNLKILSSVFSILSVVADVIGLTMFSEEEQFADLYAFLQEKFITVNAMIESNFHAIKDLQSVVLCGQTYSQVSSYKTQINSFFNRYQEMMNRSRTDRGAALAIFDIELPEYESAKVLLAMQQLLMDKSLYPSIVENCAKGSVLQYMQMMVELHHTFMEAIILDMAAKTRLHNLTKEGLDSDRTYWRQQMSQVVSLMVDAGTDLVNSTWYRFYKGDVDSSLSSTAGDSASNAAGSLDTVLTPKYPFVRTAVIVIPYDAQSISVTNAFGAKVLLVNQDSFICYRNHRANGDTVIVFCRNQITYPNEQAELNNEYATDSKGILSLGLADALRNNRWADIESIMTQYSVSFFALKVEVHLLRGSVTAVQSKAAVDLVFFQSDGTAFQALVIAKLITGTQSTGVFVPPNSVKTAPAVRAQCRVVALPAAVLLIFVVFQHMQCIKY